ncbi:hypothetical protein AMECASPLE_019655 [Ameca splendens]|uniref:Uncharacterized protein n=1 Tax=Ameca splendens TaxID=208324 RepID=A0ABV0XG39_9TELE
MLSGVTPGGAASWVKLAGSTVFSSVDAASGFWQIPLEEDRALLTTFITPLGSTAEATPTWIQFLDSS